MLSTFGERYCAENPAVRDSDDAVRCAEMATDLARQLSKKLNTSGKVSGIIPPWSAFTSLYFNFKPCLFIQSRNTLLASRDGACVPSVIKMGMVRMLSQGYPDSCTNGPD